MSKKRINHNNLLPWFTQDHGTLPAGYLASCEKFFKSIKLQAASVKQQASSNKRLTTQGPCDINRIIKEK
jgi:hypothetical protein